jgi:hypothetical protein
MPAKNIFRCASLSYHGMQHCVHKISPLLLILSLYFKCRKLSQSLMGTAVAYLTWSN